MSDVFNVLYGGNPSHYYLGIGIWHTRKEADQAKLDLEVKLKFASQNYDLRQRLLQKKWEIDQKVRDLSSNCYGSLDHQFADELLKELNELLGSSAMEKPQTTKEASSQ